MFAGNFFGGDVLASGAWVPVDLDLAFPAASAVLEIDTVTD